MKSAWIFWSIFTINLMIVVGCGSKYGKNVNQPGKPGVDYPQDQPFRTRKVNLVWEKAQKKLDATQLADLMVDLKAQDKLQLEAKKRKMGGLDDDGEYEAIVRNKLLDITEKYGIDDKWIDASNELPQTEFHPRDRSHKKPDKLAKMDKMLEKLYKKAQVAGFDSYELEQLEKELEHHKQKMEEFNQLQGQIDNMDVSDNTIDGKKQKKTINNELKQKHKDLKQNFRYLQDMVQNKNGTDKVEFSEPKVIELWLMAKKANFTEVELESIKSELRHFEAKVKKHEHFQDLADRQENKPRRNKKNVALDEGDEIKQRADELGRKVKKYHTELKSRILAHTEL